MPFVHGKPRIFVSQIFFRAAWTCLLHHKRSSIFCDPRLDCKTPCRMNNFCILCHNHRYTAFQSCCAHYVCLSSTLILGQLQLEIQIPILKLCKMPCFIYLFASGERPKHFSLCIQSPCQWNNWSAVQTNDAFICSHSVTLLYCTGDLGVRIYLKNIPLGL